MGEVKGMRHIGLWDEEETLDRERRRGQHTLRRACSQYVQASLMRFCVSRIHTHECRKSDCDAEHRGQGLNGLCLTSRKTFNTPRCSKGI